MSDPFLGLAQGQQMFNQMFYGPQLQQLDMLQKRAQINQAMGLDPVSQSNIQAQQANIDLARQQQARLQEKQAQEAAITNLKFMGGLAYSVKSLPEEVRQEVIKSIAPGVGIDPQEVTPELIDRYSSIYEAMSSNDPQLMKLALDTERLRYQKENSQNEIEQKQLDRELRLSELQLKQQTEIRQGKNLSAASEKELIDSQNSSVSNLESANQFDVLMNDYDRLKPESGVFASFDEFVSKALGSQDEVNEIRRRFNKIRLGEALKNLPPGPATDKDVEEAYKGVPPSNASAEQVKSFLRGARRLALFNAGFEQFKSEYISENGNTRGMLQEWRKPVYSSVLDRDVSKMELYEAALGRGITLEKVKQDFGVK